MTARRRHRPGCFPLAKVGRKAYGICTCATAEEVAEASRAQVVFEGCTCDVDVTVTEVAPGAWHVNLAHDDWCPRLLVAKAVSN